jgi:hypothetical protein
MGQFDGHPATGPAENPPSHAPCRHDVTQRHVVGQKKLFVLWQYAGVSGGSAMVTAAAALHEL